MERAAYIIKPEGIAHRGEIRRTLLRAGLRIVEAKGATLNPACVDILYPGLAPNLRDASIEFLTRAPVEIGIVEGEGVTARLRKLLGDKTNPDECLPGTIRHRFGVRPAVAFGGAVYYRNVIHGSKNVAEADRDIRLYSCLPPVRGSAEP